MDASGDAIRCCTSSVHCIICRTQIRTLASTGAAPFSSPALAARGRSARRRATASAAQTKSSSPQRTQSSSSRYTQSSSPTRPLVGLAAARATTTRAVLRTLSPAPGALSAKVLQNPGYAIVHNVIPLDICDELRRLSLENKNPVVELFKGHTKTGTPIPDDCRKQQDLDNAMKGVFLPVATQAVHAALGTDYNINKPVTIKSLPGGVKQPPHKDFDPNRVSEWGKGPGVAMIAAIDDGSFLYIRPNSITDMNEYRFEDLTRVEVCKGDILFFHGLATHGGGDYDRENIRIHCYLSTLLSVQSVKAQSTFPMHKK